MKIIAMLLGMIIIGVPQTVPALELVVAYGEHNAMPLTEIIDEELHGGIIKEIFDEIGRELDIRVTYRRVSRNRMESYLSRGLVHVSPNNNPAWMRYPDNYQWTTALYGDRDVFVVARKRPFTIDSIEDLRGKRLGTLLGFAYPALEPCLQKGLIERHDAETLPQNLKKLELGRIDALVGSEIQIRYHFKTLGNGDLFEIAGKAVSSHETFCACAANMPVPLKQLNDVIQKMRRDGRMQAIMERYR